MNVFYSDDDKLSLLRGRTLLSTFSFLLNVSVARSIDSEDWRRVRSDAKIWFVKNCGQVISPHFDSLIQKNAERRFTQPYDKISVNFEAPLFQRLSSSHDR